MTSFLLAHPTSTVKYSLKKVVASLMPEKCNTKQLYPLNLYNKHEHYFQSTGKRFLTLIYAILVQTLSTGLSSPSGLETTFQDVVK